MDTAPSRKDECRSADALSCGVYMGMGANTTGGEGRRGGVGGVGCLDVAAQLGAALGVKTRTPGMLQPVLQSGDVWHKACHKQKRGEGGSSLSRGWSEPQWKAGRRRGVQSKAGAPQPPNSAPRNSARDWMRCDTSIWMLRQPQPHPKSELRRQACASRHHSAAFLGDDSICMRMLREKGGGLACRFGSA